MSNEFSTPKLTPADNVKIPAVDGSNDSGYLLGGEVAQYIGSPLSGETDEYSTLESYAVGDTVIYENSLYKCTGATSGVWDSTKWKHITLKQLMAEKLSISDLASSLGQDTDTAPTNKAVDDAISSLSSRLDGDDSISTAHVKTTYTNNGVCNYYIRAGICFGFISAMTFKSGYYATVVVTQLPKSKIDVNGVFMGANQAGCASISAGGDAYFITRNTTELGVHIGNSSYGEYHYATFSYPVAYD